ncbi:MAG: MFS transporter [Caulobacterales bacterium]|nr:MFS transporter [Caulobacterales bacterium]
MTGSVRVLSQSPMSGLQWGVVVYCILLNALDGFDVLSISFAAPGIAVEWNIDRAALGLVLSMELIGMAVGSILLGSAADRYGRRPLILSCLVIMSSGMFLASTAESVEMLSAYRLFTGLGIGGMLAATNAMTAEFSNDKRRNTAVVFMATGYPLGAIIGGSIAAQLLAMFDWRAVFVFGGVATAAFLPLVWLFVPESIDFLVQRRPRDALQRINRTLQRMKRAPLDALPPPPAQSAARRPSLFAGGLATTTILLTFAYFTHIMTFYFILKWIPKIVVDMGYAPAAAAGVLVWANVGGATGSILLGLASQRAPVRGLVVGALVIATVMVAVFGRAQTDLAGLALISACAGFFINSAIVGLYAIFAASFPTELRASGTGFVIGVGRGGAALGPVVAGLLFAQGYGLPTVSLAMAAGSALAAVALTVLIMTMRRQSVSVDAGAPPVQR